MKIITIVVLALYITAPNLFCSEQITIPLTNPDQPGSLVVNHFKGSITVTGYDGNLVIVDASLRFPPKNRGGLKQINLASINLEANENNNRVELSSNSHEKTIDLQIRVPYHFSLKLQNYDNGPIEVRNLVGEMDISNQNGDINIFNLQGSAILNTVDGGIKVLFKKVTPNIPMSFSSLEGSIDLSFPGTLQALLKMKSDHGDIFSDFEIELNKRTQLAEKSKSSNTNKVYLDKWIYGKINGGGPEFLINSFNGNLFIRRNAK